MIINNEILAWRNLVDNLNGTYTFQGVYRAVLDTVQAAHALGDRVWFFSSGVGLTDPNGYNTNATVRAKLLMASSRGVLPIASATAMTITTNSRSQRPITPGKVRVNGTRPSDIVASVTGPFTFTWAHRNRNDSVVRSQSDDSVAPESGQAYNIRFRNATTNALIVEKNGVSSDSATVSLAYTGQVRVQIEAVRNGLISRAVQQYDFPHDGTGIVTSGIVTTGNIYVLDGGKP